jgi:glucans biosynthesis protein
VQDVRFVSDFFDYGNLHFKKQVPADTGYAGFRVLYALNQPNKLDELGSFLGASYYRLLGSGQSYGPSARGLAIDCGEPNQPEEFPLFTDWWLGKPASNSVELRLFAILDSVSCAGAYEFHIRPGETTAVDVDAVIYWREEDKIKAVNPDRKPLTSIGLAPLTSMFWIGPASSARFDDYRPGVHDSDGLLMQFRDGETIWRPLDDPPRLTHQHFATTNVVGFGLLQRNRDFAAYQDLFNHYYQVPSIWIKARGDWGEGSVDLMELHTTYEGLDNVVAFWSPKNKPAPLQPLRFSYTQLWTRETDLSLSTNKVTATLVGNDIGGTNRKQFAVDFAGPALFSLSETNPPRAVVGCSPNGTIIDSQVFKVHPTGAWRVMLKFEPKAGDKDPIDLRCALHEGKKQLTETWTYYWNPP